MGNNKFITVGIPTYNSSIYLKQCLDSIRGPKVINEILISDDGSNESELLKIKEIVSIYQSKYSLNITFFESEKNMGAYRNKLKLIENSKNEYIYILDSDNLASKNLESVINKILKLDNPKFLLWSNDFTDLEKYFPKNEFLYVINLENKILNDLHLLTQCKYFIVGPSTFSWWGAWLSTKTNKLCIRPKYINPSNNINFWPESWISI